MDDNDFLVLLISCLALLMGVPVILGVALLSAWVGPWSPSDVWPPLIGFVAFCIAYLAAVVRVIFR
jgi:hypothetical protein